MPSLRAGHRTASLVALFSVACACFGSGLPAQAHPPVDVSASPRTSVAQRVGVQVGHWKITELPDALSRLRGDTGTYAAGHSEVSVNLDLARRTTAILRAAGVTVDLLPASVPTGYQADAFVAIHADGNSTARSRGFKVATRWRSSTAYRDQTLVDQLDATYGATTGLPRDTAVTRNMRGYYAINTWLGDAGRISDLTPAAIIETGFLTNPTDRAFLLNQADTVAAGIANGILTFLRNKQAAAVVQARAEAVAASSPTQRSVVVVSTNASVRAAASAAARLVGVAHRGDSLVYLDSTVRPKGPFTNLHGSELASNSGYFKVAWPGIPNPVYISREAVIVQQPVPAPAH